MRRAVANQYRFTDGVGSSHDQLWALYGRNEDADAKCKRLAILGQRMKFKRVQADYKLNFPRANDEVPGVLEDAEECLLILASLDPQYPVPLNRTWSF
jgi:hypothetical protein